MRELVNKDRVLAFMKALGRDAKVQARVYLVGGASAVLTGWRQSTIDIDLKIIPDDAIFEAIPRLKKELQINLEIASPDHFIPPLPEWEERSPFIGQEGKISFFHFDFYSQALAKIERGFAQDLEDVDAMIRAELISSGHALDLFDAIESELIRYPAIDPKGFRDAVEKFFGR